MGFWDAAKSIGKAVGKEIVDTAVNDYKRNENTYNKTSEWASDRDDDRLKREFKNTSDAYKKKAIYDELKRRGY